MVGDHTLGDRLGSQPLGGTSLLLASGSTVGLGGDTALGIGGQALAQPHLLPCGIGDRIAEPAVGHLVDDIDDQELITLQDGGDDEGEAGILHGHDGEGGGQEDDVVPGQGGGQADEPKGCGPGW